MIPFVLSFLVIIVLGSSLLFTTFRSSWLERSLILARKNAEFNLQSKIAKKGYKKLNKSGGGGSNKKPEKRMYTDVRNERLNLPAGKFNLWPLLSNDVTNEFIYERAERLIELLYRDAPFFKKEPRCAFRILDEMIKQKGETLLDLFPKDKSLGDIYYKMMKGTNTGYPSLGEYFKIEKSQTVANYHYIPKKTMEAIFGEELADQIIAEEKLKQENFDLLTLTGFIQKHQTTPFDTNLLDSFFSFKKGTKQPQAGKDDELGLTAMK